MVLDAMLPVGAEEVEAQAVLLDIVRLQEPLPEGGPLGRLVDRINPVFEDSDEPVSATQLTD